MDGSVLRQDDLYKPEVVGNWLKVNGAKADKARAKWFFDEGVKAKNRRDWGLAGKAFGDAAIRYPTPQALYEAAEAELRMLGDVRDRNKNRKEYLKSDLTAAVSLYRSALATDEVLETLSDEEKQRTRHNIECVRSYIESSQTQAACAPLQAYGIKAPLK
jgi:hypothetical protein